MKKILFFAAFAAAVLCSCNKSGEALNTPAEAPLQTVHFTAGSVETKTVFGTPDGTSYPVLWSGNENVAINHNLSSANAENTTKKIQAYDDGKTASFSADFTLTDKNTFVVVSPDVALRSVNASGKKIFVEIPSGQACTDASPDEIAQVMAGYYYTDTDILSPINMPLSHVPAYLHLLITLDDLQGGIVQSVSVTSDQKNICGRFYVASDFSYEEGNAMLKSVSVVPHSLDNVWVAVAPANLSNTTLSISVNTNKGSFTKDIDLGDNHQMKSGMIYKMALNMNGIPMVEPTVYTKVTNASDLHYGDKILVVAAGSNTALSSAQNTNNRSGTGVGKSDDKNTITDPSSSVEVIQLEDGTIPGHFAFKTTVNQGYLYAANVPGSNSLRTKNTSDDSDSWAITVNGSGEATVKADVLWNSYLRFNSADNLFSAYASAGSQSAICIYRMNGPSTDTTPRFKASMPADATTIPSDAATLPVYVFGNVAWTASVAGEGASLNRTEGTGYDTLTLALAENSSSTDSRNITVTITTNASVAKQTYILSFTQNKSVGVKVNDYLLRETWANGLASATPLVYQANASTEVWNGYKVTYSQSGTTTKLYNDGVVYVPDGYSGGVPLPSNMMNLMLAKSSWWKVTGIPCRGVKTAKVVYRINRNGASYYTVTSDTEGVTVSNRTQAKNTSSWEKNYYEVSYTITFDDGFTGSKFNLQFNNTHASNNLRMADIDVQVTGIK